MTDTVLFEQRDAIALLTLNRPEKLNALDYATNDRLLALLDTIEVDSTVRAVVITGAGERAFSAGGDIHEFAASIRRGADEAVRAFCRRGQAMTARFESFPKPGIAAVNGIAFGGGCEITRPCIWRSPRSERCSPSRRSTSAFRRLLAGRSASRVWPGASARSNYC
jgi:enoyl-CoA hydratase